MKLTQTQNDTHYYKLSAWEWPFICLSTSFSHNSSTHKEQCLTVSRLPCRMPPSVLCSINHQTWPRPSHWRGKTTEWAQSRCNHAQSSAYKHETSQTQIKVCCGRLPRDICSFVEVSTFSLQKHPWFMVLWSLCCVFRMFKIISICFVNVEENPLNFWMKMIDSYKPFMRTRLDFQFHFYFRTKMMICFFEPTNIKVHTIEQTLVSVCRRIVSNVQQTMCKTPEANKWQLNHRLVQTSVKERLGRGKRTLTVPFYAFTALLCCIRLLQTLHLKDWITFYMQQGSSSQGL